MTKWEGFGRKRPVFEFQDVSIRIKAVSLYFQKFYNDNKIIDALSLFKVRVNGICRRREGSGGRSETAEGSVEVIEP